MESVSALHFTFPFQSAFPYINSAFDLCTAQDILRPSTANTLEEPIEEAGGGG
jgi:hypothetical protein